MEPPVYVSDRRLVKSIQLLQVSPGGQLGLWVTQHLSRAQAYSRT